MMCMRGVLHTIAKMEVVVEHHREKFWIPSNSICLRHNAVHLVEFSCQID